MKQRITGTVMPVLIALSLAHLINDLLQTTVTANYPLIKSDLDLTFAQIGSISFVYQIAASVFQPLVGMFFDRHHLPWAIVLATAFTLCGITGLALSPSLPWVYMSVATVGIGSSILHPEASRVTSLASGGRRGFAQSVFQVGGNLGGSFGPLLIALIVAPFGRRNMLWFIIFSALSFCVTSYISSWFSAYIKANGRSKAAAVRKDRPLPLATTIAVIILICILIISKYIYLESLKSYYTFYLIDKFGVTVQTSQICLFVLLFATAVGTLVGGPLGDRIGRKWVIVMSILGTAPFSLAMPHAGFAATIVLSFCAGFVLSSAFPAIILYAQELLPNNLGLVSGLFFGFAFGVAGIVSAILGNLIDAHGIELVYNITACSPLLGLVAFLLPDLNRLKKRNNA